MKHHCTCETANCTGKGCLFDGGPTLVPDHLVEESDGTRRFASAIYCAVAEGAFLVGLAATLGWNENGARRRRSASRAEAQASGSGV